LGWTWITARGLMALTYEQSCAIERRHVNQNGMEKMGMCKAYLGRTVVWATIALPSLQSLHLP
jgi:hypothetical protein